MELKNEVHPQQSLIKGQQRNLWRRTRGRNGAIAPKFNIAITYYRVLRRAYEQD